MNQTTAVSSGIPAIAWRRAVLAAAALLLAMASTAPAQTDTADRTFTVGELQKMLDRQIAPMVVPDELLTGVLKKLQGTKADWIELPADTLAYLPYGDQTPVAFRTPRMSLRDLVNTLVEPLCLRARVVEDTHGKAVLRILPREELVRIGHRASIDEMELLQVLRSLKVTSLQTPLKEQIERATNRPVDFFFDVTGMDASAANRHMEASIKKMQQNTAASLLEQVCAENRWTWRVNENVIIINDRTKQVVHQLRRVVTVQWRELPVDDALIELGHAAGVPVQFQPAVMDTVEEQNRRLTWTIPNQQILQTIEKVTARTGLAYEIREESIYFYGSRSSWRTDPVVGMVDIPCKSGGFTFRTFVRKSMLPEDVQPLIDSLIQDTIDKMASDLRASAPAPAPAPEHPKE